MECILENHLHPLLSQVQWCQYIETRPVRYPRHSSNQSPYAIVDYKQLGMPCDAQMHGKAQVHMTALGLALGSNHAEILINQLQSDE